MTQIIILNERILFLFLLYKKVLSNGNMKKSAVPLLTTVILMVWEVFSNTKVSLKSSQDQAKYTDHKDLSAFSLFKHYLPK